MEENKSSDEDFVVNTNVKTIKTLRKNSAKKTAQSSKSIRGSIGAQKESQKDFKISKKPQHKSRIIVRLSLFH